MYITQYKARAGKSSNLLSCCPIYLPLSRLLPLQSATSQPTAIMSNVSAEVKTPITGAFQQPTGLFINNEFIEGVEKKTFEVINPATEEVICSVHEATEKDVDVAVAAARKAFEGPWRRTTPAQRGMYLWKLAEICEKNTDLLASVESLDNGKSITMARGDIGAAIATIRYYAGWADKIEGKTIDVNPDTFHYTRREPVGAPRRTR
jgi:aldehyde dehydrogenase (NAD+)